MARPNGVNRYAANGTSSQGLRPKSCTSTRNNNSEASAWRPTSVTAAGTNEPRAEVCDEPESGDLGPVRGVRRCVAHQGVLGQPKPARAVQMDEVVLPPPRARHDQAADDGLPDDEPDGRDDHPVPGQGVRGPAPRRGG